MNIYVYIIIGILIPFFGTMFGSGLVFFFKNKINKNIEKVLLGFASGVMMAASVWSLLIPALSSYNNSALGAIIISIGLITGALFILISNKYLNISKVSENVLTLAITLHNIPEGMAVGVAFAEVLKGQSFFVALPLAIGIAIQNIPEGATISLPFRSKGINRFKSFIYGVLSGGVEPIFALLTLGLSSFINSILPFLLSFAAGAMILVVVEELIPEAEKDGKNNIATIGFIVGFIVMMSLDNIF